MTQTLASDPGRIRDLLSDKRVCLLLVGQTLSAFGDNIMWIGAGVWVKELTGSTPAAGLVIFAIAAPQLLASPFAGLLADRMNRKRLMITVNAVGAFVVLPMLFVHSASEVWLIYLCMAGYGLSAAALNPAQSAIIADVVQPNLLSAANGTLRGAQEALRVAAPVTGAVLVTAVGPPSAIILDSATFGIAALFVVFLPAQLMMATSSTDSTFLRSFFAGVRFGWNEPILRRVMIAGCLIFVAYGLSETVIYALPAMLHERPYFVGVLSSATGIGAVVGGVTAVMVARHKGNLAVSTAGMVFLAVACPLQASGNLPLVLCGEAIFGLSLPWVTVGLYTLLQLRSTRELQGRVFGAFEVIAGTPQVGAIAVGAGAIAAAGPRYLLLIMAGFAIAASISLFWHRPPFTDGAV